MQNSITEPLAAVKFRFHDAAKVKARLAELGVEASLLEAEGVRTFHAPKAVLVALNEADLQPRSLQFLTRVLDMVKRDLACRLASGLPLPELPVPRGRRRYVKRPETRATRPSATHNRAVHHFDPPSRSVPRIVRNP